MSHHQPNPNINVNLTIDGVSVTVPEGTRILEAAKKANVNIPTLCEHPELCKRALCRICVVEADGRGKLIAACANDVWEGVSIVTTNQRLLNIRKTIIELILANHPQDCLSCIRNTKCELQLLAKSFGIGAGSSAGSANAGASTGASGGKGGSSFENAFSQNGVQERRPVIESETLVRDMDKCVKCGRCVEVCQEVQTIRAINTAHRSFKYEISTPYKQALQDGPCVFCGKCAAVCPVGAIYEHDQTAQVRAVLQTALADNSRKTIAQISPNFASAVNDELALAANTITTGKLISAVKLLGFDKVYDAQLAANAVEVEIAREVQERKIGIKQPGSKQPGGCNSLPVISGCSAGAANFVKNFYPDLADHLTAVKSKRQYFASAIKDAYAKEAGIASADITSVSFFPCLAHKYNVESPLPSPHSPVPTNNFAITAAELTRMLKLAGIVIESLPEEPFDVIGLDLPYMPVKKEQGHGYAQARKVMEAIREGKCDAEWVEIFSCPEEGCR